MTPEDLEFLRQVTLIIEACHSRTGFMKRDLVGGSRYAAQLTEDELGAIHNSMKWFIQDKKEQAR